MHNYIYSFPRAFAERLLHAPGDRHMDTRPPLVAGRYTATVLVLKGTTMGLWRGPCPCSQQLIK